MVLVPLSWRLSQEALSAVEERLWKSVVPYICRNSKIEQMKRIKCRLKSDYTAALVGITVITRVLTFPQDCTFHPGLAERESEIFDVFLSELKNTG